MKAIDVINEVETFMDRLCMKDDISFDIMMQITRFIQDLKNKIILEGENDRFKKTNRG